MKVVSWIEREWQKKGFQVSLFDADKKKNLRFGQFCRRKVIILRWISDNLLKFIVI